MTFLGTPENAEKTAMAATRVAVAGKRVKNGLPSILDVAVAAGLTPIRCSRDEFRVTCPAHDDQRPSCRLNVEKNVYRCDPCAATGIDPGGGVVKFARILGVDWKTIKRS